MGMSPIWEVYNKPCFLRLQQACIATPSTRVPASNPPRNSIPRTSRLLFTPLCTFAGAREAGNSLSPPALSFPRFHLSLLLRQACPSLIPWGECDSEYSPVNNPHIYSTDGLCRGPRARRSGQPLQPQPRSLRTRQSRCRPPALAVPHQCRSRCIYAARLWRLHW